MNSPCEYCGCDLPFGTNKRTRQIRSFHFQRCEKRPKREPVESPSEELQRLRVDNEKLRAENEALKRPLTDEQMFAVMKSVSALGTVPWGWREIGRAVEAAHLKAAQAAKERT